MNRLLLIGILWVLAGLVLLFAAFAREPTHTPMLIMGVISVAGGAALMRRSRRR